MRVQDISSETDECPGGVIGGDGVELLRPLSIKGKQCDRVETEGESQSDPFMMKEEMGYLRTHGSPVTRPPR